MYQISELAESVGLSRATLLYYEKLGLLKGKRQANGYRVYTDADRQRLRLMQQLQAGGLSLQECQACLDGKLDREMLGRRLETLEREIAEKTRSRDLLAALLGRSSLKDWHEEVERVAPDLHRAWLMSQGFSSAEAGLVALVSKDMNAHDAYMAGFMEVFADLDWWGPGTAEATRRALTMVPFAPETILEIGCGPGMATITLAEASTARIMATDTAEVALDKLRARIAARGLNDRIEVRNVDMAALPAPERPWDVIWSEGSADILGVEKALADWWALLHPGGVLVFSDMVWRTDKPADEVREFWAAEYPRDDDARDPHRAGEARGLPRHPPFRHRAGGDGDLLPPARRAARCPRAASRGSPCPRRPAPRDRRVRGRARAVRLRDVRAGAGLTPPGTREDRDMDYSTDYTTHVEATVELFASTFTASEGAEEGALIGALARRLIAETPAGDLRVFTAWEDGTLVGGIFFTRLTYEGDPRTVFMMAPVAVATAHQGKGIGQRLIAHGLDALRREDVDIAVTYGDPAFYGRVGFEPVSAADLPAPQPLNQPQGWIAQSLTEAPLTPLRGPARCVAAFDDPALW
jgi:predicted N-acetyltransferase YhbS/DNA-binding transcriptional MerR regulator/predicted O-methyltransferase YrrM